MRHALFLLILTTAAVFRAEAGTANLNPTLAVGIFSGRGLTACTVTGHAPIALSDESGRQLAELPPGAAVKVVVDDEKVLVSCERPHGQGKSAQYVFTSSSPIEIRPDGSKPRAYRGTIEMSVRDGHLALIDRIALEDYLRGVLPSEIPSSFSREALRAQAIAARTYAIMSGQKHGAEGFDLCDGPHCQVYLGVAGERPATDAAVRDTAGLVLTYEHKLIQAVYCDSCGGRTAGNETAWQGSDPLPYLRPVRDADEHGTLCDQSPRNVWTRQILQSKLAAALVQFKVAAPITTIEPASTDANGRPQEYTIRGSQGDVTIRGGVLRDSVNRALGATTLPSADFTAAPNGDSFVFAGRGSGHGVGLCQWGANAMAKAGRTAAEILTHYYTGVTVEPISAEVASRAGQRRSG
jgi:stage II sporulation protein D